jgi:hypothetical protein
MDWISLIIGATLGFCTSTLTNYMKRTWDQQDLHDRGKKLLSAVAEEVTTAISRAKTFDDLIRDGQVSFGRIYTGLWDSLMVELASIVDDINILKSLHWYYYQFDLINFNLERGGQMIVTGHGFAQSSIKEMTERLPVLRPDIKKYNEKIKKSWWIRAFSIVNSRFR